MLRLTRTYSPYSTTPAAPKKKISFTQYKELRDFPLVNLGKNKSGFIINSKDKRINPYVLLANRTIGLARDNADGRRATLALIAQKYGRPTREIYAAVERAKNMVNARKQDD